MLGEAQDVLLAAETSLALHHNRGRRSGRPAITEEAPHCVTCCCVDNRLVTCGQRCISSGRRHSPRRNTTVDELLREMSFGSPMLLSDEETYVNGKREVEDESSVLVSPARPSRRARGGGGGGSYCAEGKSPETTARSCERWNQQQHLEVDTQIRSVAKSERHSDGGSKRKWPPSSDRKTSRRQQQQLLGAGDRNAKPEEPAKATTDVDEEEHSSTSDALAEEAHVRELKLVRWQFIERIYEEVAKLHRLQRHLDGCCSPPPPTLARRRSVSTMTSARQQQQQTSEQPEGQF